MSVSRKLLMLKSDQELLSYIAPDNKFVPEANSIALEILQNRGHQFTTEELQLIRQQIAVKEKSEENYIHPHHQSAANLIIMSVLLAAIQVGLYYELIQKYTNLYLDLLGLLVILMLGYYASRGSQTVKYFFLIFILAGVAGVISLMMKKQMTLEFNILMLLQFALQIWAVVLLFRIPRADK